MDDGWPHGEEAFVSLGGAGGGGSNGNGSPTLAWHDRNTSKSVTGLGQGQGQPGMPPRLGETHPVDPFAMGRPPILDGGGGGRAAAAAAVAFDGNGVIREGEIRAKAPGVSRPRYSKAVVLIHRALLPAAVGDTCGSGSV